MPFLTDEIRWYNNGVWGELGYAVPAVGNDPRTVNAGIAYLVSAMGRNLSAIMQMPDADLRTPPSIAAITKLVKLINRARNILAARAVPTSDPEMQAIHATPAPQDHLIYPVPYFNVRNVWLKEYCGLTLMAISEAVQHTDNRKPLDFSTIFSGLVGQYIQRVYKRIAMELLMIPKETAEAADFVIDLGAITYEPEKWFTSTELIDTVPPVVSIPTEDDLKVITDGIPATLVVNAVRWPAGGPLGGTVTSTSGGSTTSGAAGVASFPSAVAV